MSDVQFEVKNKILQKQKTTWQEFLVIIIIIVIFIIIFIIIWFTLVPKLFTSESTSKNCSTTSYPDNIIITQPDIFTPSIEITWNPVFEANSLGETILGYNVYIDTVPTVNDNSQIYFTPAKKIIITKINTNNIQAGTTYYIRVATKDTCGVGTLSLIQSFTTVT